VSAPSLDRALFDSPGPRGRRRIRYLSAVTLLAFVAVMALGLQRFAAHGQLAAGKWRPFTQTGYLRFLWAGLRGTLLATGISALLTFPLGTALALARLSHRRPLRYLATGYVELLRGLPLLLVIYAFLLALPTYGINLPILWKLVVPIVMVNAAVVAETLRAGVRALDRGQSEAAGALGLTHWQSLRAVVLPQAIRVVLPSLVAQLVTLVKDSTLGYVVSYPELMTQGNALTVYTHLLIQTFLVIAAVYLAINIAISRLATGLEARLRRPRPGRALRATMLRSAGPPDR